MIHSEPWKHAVNTDARCPVVNRGLYWVGYDNAWSIRQKVRYALDRGLAGIAIKNMEMDDWNKVCKQRMVLMKTVARQMQHCRVTLKRKQ
ncbi:putative chitinase [Dermacentor silvarum]|uniref:putative chitinase n=1 Tax=Dermacentor silvarum TaxID=543639 RepID=UPI00210128F7|nr:putative chitinase [Dermacentor silvarum]